MPYDDDKMPFYALGTNLAVQVGGQANFKTLLEADEMDVCLEAFCDTLRGTALTDARTVLSTYGPQLNKILQERTSRIMDLVKKEGQEYIANFLDCTEEAVQTDSGLVYYEMKAGTGAQPTIKSTVEVHYHGTLIDGTVFDSSVDRGQTISFPLGGVIRGWQEGLQLMKEGGKATLVIPGDLAYGDAGSGDSKCATARFVLGRLGYRHVDRVDRSPHQRNILSRYRLYLSLLQPFHPVRLSSLKWSYSRWMVNEAFDGCHWHLVSSDTMAPPKRFMLTSTLMSILSSIGILLARYGSTLLNVLML
jgi:FKBP-type peptidyl-prolyl cis-trans isomerase